ncbi:MAG: DUF6807 family protein [Pirellula sp.]
MFSRPLCIALLIATSLPHSWRIEAQDRSRVISQGDLSLEENDVSITIKKSGRIVLCYNKVSPPVPAGMNPVYARSGFLHPVATPAQRVVTAAFPPDHAHQHGIFSAWVQTIWNGRNVDFWNLAGETGRVLHERVVSTFAQDGKVGFEADLLHRAVQVPASDVLRERWRITAFPTESGHHGFDLDTVQEAITDEPLTIKQYHYGGVAFRGLVQWLSPKDSYAKEKPKDWKWEPSEIINEFGSDRIKGNHEHVRWVALNGQIDGKPVSISVLGHRENFRAPQAARLHGSKPYFVYSPCVDGEFVIDREHPYRAKYRFLLTDAPADPAWLNKQWESW